MILSAVCSVLLCTVAQVTGMLGFRPGDVLIVKWSSPKP